MHSQPSLRARRSIASRRKKCAGAAAAAVIAAGAEGAGAGAAAVTVAGIGAGVAAVVGAAATGVVVVTTGKSPPGYVWRGIKKAPRERGFCRALKISVSAAASIAPHGAVRAAATGAHNDDPRCGPHNDDRGRTNHNGPAIGLATTIRTAMPAGAASARGFRGAEAGNGAQGQNCCEKVLHVLSRFRPQGRHGSEPIHEQLNGT
jgi:hypothetical protein